MDIDDLRAIKANYPASAVILVSPREADEIRCFAGFVPISRYARKQPFFSNEIGSIEGVRIIEREFLSLRDIAIRTRAGLKEWA